jgi:hypothetical protein
VLNLDQDRTTLEIRPPFVDPETPVTVGIDYYGASPRLQLLCYGTQIDESQVDVQYDAAGNVAAVEVNDPSVTLRLWDSRRGDVDIRTDGNRVEVVTSREVVHVVRAAPEMPAWRVARDRQQGM